MLRLLQAALVTLVALSSPLAAQMRLPLMSKPPVIDGRIDPAEWSSSAGFDGLEMNGELQRRRVHVYIAATETTIYVAIRSQLPAKGALAASVTSDTVQTVFDDAAEIYINPTPDGKDGVAYQFVFNSLAHGGYDYKCIGKATEHSNWKGNWKVACTTHDGWWDAECAIPIDSMTLVSKGRKTTDGSWRINVTRDWKNPWEWSALTSGQFSTGGYEFVIDPAAPAVDFMCDSDPSLGKCTGRITARNTGASDIAIKGRAVLSVNGTATGSESTIDKTLKPGESVSAPIEIPDSAKDSACRLSTKLTSGDGKTTYYDRVADWKRADAPIAWDATAAATQTQLLQVTPAPDEAFFGARIQRTMSLLSTSNKSRHLPVHIVIYGQSITGSNWWNWLKKDLETRFPDADLVIENRSIGGLGADILSRLAIHQLYPYYPDLVIFHCYGSENDYERIFSDIRRYTTSEIMIFTHHVMNIAQQRELPWETRSHNISQDMSSDELRSLGQKYGIEIVDLRPEWKQYIHEHHLQPSDLVGEDGVHMNGHGEELLAHLVGRHFRYNPLFSAPWYNEVRLYDARRPIVDAKDDEITYSAGPWELDGDSMVGTSARSRMKLAFEGNRVDIIPGAVSAKDAKLGSARILIDGKPPSADPDCCFATLPSGAPGTIMPGLLRTTHLKPLVPEDWTLRITSMSPDAKELTYEVVGSVTGPDGSGNNREKFVSKSGRVVIEPQDLERITWAHNNTEKRCYVGFEVTWSVRLTCLDTYKATAAKDASHLRLITVAQGMKNAHHTLEVVPNGDGAVPIKAIQVYTPPMK